MLSEITAIAVKVEAVKGTEVSADADIYVEDLQINPTGEHIPRGGTGVYLGTTYPGIIGGQTGKCTFTAELRGDGSQGLDPGLAILLQACGYKQTVEVYNTHSAFADQKTISIDVFQNGILKTLYGAAGTFTMEGEEGQRVLFRFDFDGLFKDTVDEAVPAYTPSTVAPMMWTGGTFTMGGISQLISRFTLDAGNNVVPKQDIAGPGGVTYFFQSTYNPTVSFDPEAKLKQTDPVLQDWTDAVEGALVLAFTDGTDIITIDALKVQYTEVPEGLRNNLRIYEVTGQCRHSAGNDAVTFTVT